MLEDLRARLEAALEVKSADIWDGAWHALADPGRISIAAPAALVSLTALDLDHRAQSRYAPGQLRGAAAGGPDLSVDPAPHARADIAVAFLASDPHSGARAQRVLGLAETALPVLLAFAATDIRGSNLYTPALHKKGLAAFVLVARRDVELGPEHPAPARPGAVDAIDGAGARRALWRREAA